MEHNREIVDNEELKYRAEKVFDVSMQHTNPWEKEIDEWWMVNELAQNVIDYLDKKENKK